MRFLYSAGIFIYGFILQLAAIFNLKARSWILGRKDWKQKLKQAIVEKNPEKLPLLWFHAASLGEFEQGRPVIEAIKSEFHGVKILLTFFSPSGYEIRKNYEQADLVFYLPLDTNANAGEMVKIVNPAMVFFIKYDFWFNFLRALKAQKIPVYFISASFRKTQLFFRCYGIWFRRQLSAVTWFFVQNETSRDLLASIGLKNSSVTGDTRFDRVFTIAKMKKEFPLIRKFCAKDPVFIAGSTWKEDEAVIIPLIRKESSGMKFILAPHDTSSARIESLISRYGKPVLKYSELNEKNALSSNVLIIDTIGILNQLYQYAAFAFIGGGFGNSIHNIQEPITFGVPVFFGPNFGKFKEAVELVNLGGAFCTPGEAELHFLVKTLLSDPDSYQKASSVCRQYVDENRGASEKILDYLKEIQALRGLD